MEDYDEMVSAVNAVYGNGWKHQHTDPIYRRITLNLKTPII